MKICSMAPQLLSSKSNDSKSKCKATISFQWWLRATLIMQWSANTLILKLTSVTTPTCWRWLGVQMLRHYKVSLLIKIRLPTTINSKIVTIKIVTAEKMPPTSTIFKMPTNKKLATSFPQFTHWSSRHSSNLAIPSKSIRAALAKQHSYSRNT